MAGKGDKWRKTDFKSYRNNFDQIFKKDLDSKGKKPYNAPIIKKGTNDADNQHRRDP